MDDMHAPATEPLDALVVRVREFWLFLILGGVALGLLSASQFGKPEPPLILIISVVWSTATAVGNYLRGRFLQCDTFIVDKSADEISAILLHPPQDRQWLGRAWVVCHLVAFFFTGVIIGWMCHAIFSF